MRTRPVVPAHRRDQRGTARAAFGPALPMYATDGVVGVGVGRLAFMTSDLPQVADAGEGSRHGL